MLARRVMYAGCVFLYVFLCRYLGLSTFDDGRRAKKLARRVMYAGCVFLCVFLCVLLCVCMYVRAHSLGNFAKERTFCKAAAVFEASLATVHH